MLAKMKTRYSSQQMQILTTCTLLDIRYKSSKYLLNGFDQLEKDVKEILEDQEQSQNVIPATQGQELHNLSSFEGHSSNDNKSIFDFEDDDGPLPYHLLKDIQVMTTNHFLGKTSFPCLFKSAQGAVYSAWTLDGPLEVSQSPSFRVELWGAQPLTLSKPASPSSCEIVAHHGYSNNKTIKKNIP